MKLPEGVVVLREADWERQVLSSPDTVIVDEEPGLAKRYDVQGLPTVLVVQRGEVCQRRVGLMGRERLRGVVDACLK